MNGVIARANNPTNIPALLKQPGTWSNLIRRSGMSTISGIYEIRNVVNGHRYIGSTVDIYGRWRTHRHSLRNNTHHSDHLQKAWHKYGEDVFIFEILERCERVNLIEREQYFIDSLCPEYNISKTAGKSRLGTKQTPEEISKRKSSRAGYRHSPETIAKISAGNRGKVRSPEYREWLSLSQKGRPGNRLGAKHTKESREKISRSSKGQVISSEQREKISIALTGRVVSQETKERLSAARKEWWRKKREQEETQA